MGVGSRSGEWVLGVGYMVDAVMRFMPAGGEESGIPRLPEMVLPFAVPPRADTLVIRVYVFPVAGFVQAVLTFTQAFPPGENPLTCQISCFVSEFAVGDVSPERCCVE